MRNIKGLAVANDGNMKRMAITFDEIDDTGKVVGGNIKVNRVVTDNEAVSAINALESYAQSIIDAE